MPRMMMMMVTMWMIITITIIVHNELMRNVCAL